MTAYISQKLVLYCRTTFIISVIVVITILCSIIFHKIVLNMMHSKKAIIAYVYVIWSVYIYIYVYVFFQYVAYQKHF